MTEPLPSIINDKCFVYVHISLDIKYIKCNINCSDGYLDSLHLHTHNIEGEGVG